jgi:hypothetical protein
MDTKIDALTMMRGFAAPAREPQRPSVLRDAGSHRSATAGARLGAAAQRAEASGRGSRRQRSQRTEEALAPAGAHSAESMSRAGAAAAARTQRKSA